jgi:hypothetical protein
MVKILTQRRDAAPSPPLRQSNPEEIQVQLTKMVSSTGQTLVKHWSNTGQRLMPRGDTASQLPQCARTCRASSGQNRWSKLMVKTDGQKRVDHGQTRSGSGRKVRSRARLPRGNSIVFDRVRSCSIVFDHVRSCWIVFDRVRSCSDRYRTGEPIEHRMGESDIGRRMQERTAP